MLLVVLEGVTAGIVLALASVFAGHTLFEAAAQPAIDEGSFDGAVTRLAVVAATVFGSALVIAALLLRMQRNLARYEGASGPPGLPR